MRELFELGSDSTAFRPASEADLLDALLATLQVTIHKTPKTYEITPKAEANQQKRCCSLQQHISCCVHLHTKLSMLNHKAAAVPITDEVLCPTETRCCASASLIITHLPNGRTDIHVHEQWPRFTLHTCVDMSSGLPHSCSATCTRLPPHLSDTPISLSE